MEANNGNGNVSAIVSWKGCYCFGSSVVVVLCCCVSHSRRCVAMCHTATGVLLNALISRVDSPVWH